MFNRAVTTLILLFLTVLGYSQNCLLSMDGYIRDSGTDEPLEYVTIYMKESAQGTMTDSLGYFQFKDLCAGHYHLVMSHVGCEAKQTLVELRGDSTLEFFMDHTHAVLEDIVIEGRTSLLSTQEIETINRQAIADHAQQNLSNILESITGVTTLRNGNSISKPVIHGLYGNRITIINNGIPQSGQQWGNDHSPEIDPLVANTVSVVKGTSALEYMGNNLGSLVIVAPAKIGQEPHLHGSARYYFETNGLGHGLNLNLNQSTPAVAWKVNGTLKKAGDRKAAHYFLNNTGSQEANLALQLEKVFSDTWTVDVYASTFNTKLGVLRGSHIGNLTDLSEALTREVPFFTPDTFSYRLEAPMQQVGHHLLKLHSTYIIDASQKIDFTLAGQFNNRKEFDVRRSGRTDIPALSLQQYSFFAEGKYIKSWENGWGLKAGAQFNGIENNNNPETGILPLVPDYLSYESGAYLLISKKYRHFFLDLGARYDRMHQKVATISGTIPRSIIRYDTVYHNLSSSGGFRWLISPNYSISGNLGFTSRNPAINELYSQGLHQGVSGIEEGTLTLTSEQSFKATLGFVAKVNKAIDFESLVYYQAINNYIFLNPQNEIRLTIRGAFPVFKYAQTDAEIFGIDLSSTFRLNHSAYVDIKYSYIQGNDLTQDLPLINIPSNNVMGRIGYQFEKPLKIGKKQLENLEFNVDYRYVFRQNNLLPEQDFVLPPDGYGLLGLNLSTDIQLAKTRLRVTAQVDNLLNTSYRDYLNRQRYFADDWGVNVILGVGVSF